MSGEGDLSRLLPRPPLPAPARREAAIAEALRRFDGGGAQPSAQPEPRRPWIIRPIGGGLAAASVAALIAVSTIWMGSADPPAQIADADKPAPFEVPAKTVPAPADAAGPTYADAGAANERSTAPGGAATARSRAAPAAHPRPASPSAPSVRPREPIPEEVALAQADAAGADASGIIVTGSRIRRPVVESATPVTTIGGEDLFAGDNGTPAAARGDWNACTVADPARDLAACRSVMDIAAAGARGQAAAHIADGLTQAWQGDQARAIAAFDRAIAIDRRSASAYLNRGLVRQALGDPDRALADLSRAIRLDPRAARGYYHRSRLLRECGDIARARADAARAVRLDPGYAALFQPNLPER